MSRNVFSSKAELVIRQNQTENRLWGNPIQLCSSAELDVNKQLRAFESCLVS